MRPLTEEESKAVFGHLSKYIGDNIKVLLDRPDGLYCFRLQKQRVYYISEKILKQALNFSREHIQCAGVCFGKFTKTYKFHLHVTALDFLAPYAINKVWLKPSAEQSFLYGNHAMKSGVARLSENIEKYQGVVVYNANDLPLGFGVSARSTLQYKNSDPMSLMVLHQADTGEYLRDEENLL